MSNKLYSDDNICILEKDGKFLIRYDAGAHQVEIREDEISEEDAIAASSSVAGATKVLCNLQNRLIVQGIDPYKSNTDNSIN